ncbi:cellulase family glycosylhydrolase [Lederbergia wuyishanensis]|uniref:Endoglycosylceramidase n=1 Tax=Lederbergia wuyishanensis TaxID=1347903 RepID=A0ABU0D452_9BACI|nr:cellulase family glycosylhydrolase [Lederbergia wuyishanensis]MCJ8008223.1 cellulase family glycosylhydrolase [Lederbergia wuyishanensis]MDQ0343188.1 endoglycosylceramidase [Lederbergia wuyishanensis]
MSKHIKVDGNRFVDKSRRQVLLHGVNMVCKDKTKNYIGSWTEEDFQKLHSWGMNVIRLGVIWDGIEPEPGVYDDQYVEKLRCLIQMANQYDLHIFLDMHQDLFSSEFADGAPAWATITDGELFEPGHIWSDAYLFNSAVQNAFDHFWNNTPGPDGIGIQDHFINAWGYLVEKLHTEPNIIGYDLMNEPFIGSGVQKVNELMFTTYANIYSERYGEVDIEQLFLDWSNPNNKHDYLSLLEDVDSFKRVIDSSVEVLQSFEKNQLSKLYCNVAKAIRTTDKNGILFLETNYFSNLGVSSAILSLENEQAQAYAPHAYDLVTDTELAHTANDRRLEFIFERHEETRKRLGIPMLIGEWGAFYETDNTGHVSLHIQRLLEKHLSSDTYWSYTPNMDKSLSFLGVCRGYPIAVAGRILQYRYEHSLQTFQMKWDESTNIAKPSIIYLPDTRDISVTLSPNGSTYSISSIDNSHAGYIEIPPITDGIRSITITKHR